MLLRELTETVYGNQLVLCDEEGVCDCFERSMILTNEIPGILSAIIQNRNGRECFVYELSGRQSLFELYKNREITYPELKRIFEGHKRLYQSLSEFLLEPSGLLLTPETVFADILSGELSFVYFPGYLGDFLGDLKELWEYLLWRVDHSDKKAVQMSYRFYSKLVQGDFSVDEFLEEEEGGQEAESVQAARTETDNENKPVKKYSGEPKEKTASKQHPPSMSLLICGTGLVIIITIVILIYFFGSEEIIELMYNRWTVCVVGTIGAVLALIPILSVNRAYQRKMTQKPPNKEKESNRADTKEENKRSGSQKVAYFSRNRDGSDRTLPILKGSAIIGKSGEADIQIDSRAVSRRHAKISVRDGIYHISDLGSMNGTYLNGRRLKEEESGALRSADEVRFADEIFYFFCYTDKG